MLDFVKHIAGSEDFETFLIKWLKCQMLKVECLYEKPGTSLMDLTVKLNATYKIPTCYHNTETLVNSGVNEK